MLIVILHQPESELLQLLAGPQPSLPIGHQDDLRCDHTDYDDQRAAEKDAPGQERPDRYTASRTHYPGDKAGDRSQEQADLSAVRSRVPSPCVTPDQEPTHTHPENHAKPGPVHDADEDPAESWRKSC